VLHGLVVDLQLLLPAVPLAQGDSLADHRPGDLLSEGGLGGVAEPLHGESPRNRLGRAQSEGRANRKMRQRTRRLTPADGAPASPSRRPSGWRTQGVSGTSRTRHSASTG
jgi:hypothetical protein